MLPRCVLRAGELCTPLTPGCAQRGYQVQFSEFLSALFHYLWCSLRMFSFKSHMRIAIDLMTAVDLDPCQQVIALILPRLDWTRIKMSSVLIREGVHLGSWYGSGHKGVVILLPGFAINSLRPRRTGRYNADDIFKCIFWKKIFEFRL